jgi:hypothetical protein
MIRKMSTAPSDFVKKPDPRTIAGNKTAKELSVRFSENGSYAATSILEPPTKREFTIRFSASVTVRETLSRKDYTPEEVKAYWYSHEESKAIRKQRSQEIRRINMGERLKDKKYCSRGLEGHTKIGAESKNRIRKVAINAVLDEQWLQWGEFIFDEYAIADIYNDASSRCQIRAHHVAVREHKEDDQDTYEYTRYAAGGGVPKINVFLPAAA